VRVRGTERVHAVLFVSALGIIACGAAPPPTSSPIVATNETADAGAPIDAAHPLDAAEPTVAEAPLVEAFTPSLSDGPTRDLHVGRGEGCIGLTSSCRSRRGFEVPSWCDGREADRASVSGQIVIEIVGGDASLGQTLLDEAWDVTTCQREAIAVDPRRAVGEVRASLRVVRGCVDHVRLVSSTLHDPRFTDCVVAALRGARLPTDGRLRIRVRATLE
jgi:hypothetical protein